jgi:hypothetical protein
MAEENRQLPDTWFFQHTRSCRVVLTPEFTFTKTSHKMRMLYYCLVQQNAGFSVTMQPMGQVYHSLLILQWLPGATIKIIISGSFRHNFSR